MTHSLPPTQDLLPHPDQVQSLVSFLEHEPQPMIVLDPDYNILAANTAYLRQFGSADKPFIGHKCYRVSHHYDVPCDQAGENCPMKKARRCAVRIGSCTFITHRAGPNTSMWNCARS